MSAKPLTVLGLMSGTSLDGLDVVVSQLTLTQNGQVTAANTRHMGFPYPAGLKHRVMAVIEGRPFQGSAFWRLHHDLGHWMARQAAEAVAGWGLKRVDLAGLHGQTVWHHPHPGEDPDAAPWGLTWQLGEPAALSLALGCPVVSDFRTHDMLLGGQGAPLVPLAQSCLLPSQGGDMPLATLNLGGIANGAVFCPGQPVAASDFGPANVWLDAALPLYGHGEAFDRGGQLALGGEVDQAFFDRLRAWDDFPRQPPPASTGREHYTLSALEKLLTDDTGQRPGLPNALATLAAYSAWAVARGFAALGLPPDEEMALCVGGGGVHNGALVAALKGALPGARWRSCQEVFGVDPQALEAFCFAVLAMLRWRGVPLGEAGVTGVDRPVLLGKITQV